MSTLGEIIDTIAHALSGYDSSKDSVAALSSGIDADDLTLSLDAIDGNVGRGIAEIDLEIIRIKSVDATSGNATVWPFGRGYRSTTAAAHSSGAEVRLNPSWPRITVARAINECINEIYPSVYSVVVEESTIPADYGAIDLAGDPVGVISVWIEDDSVTDGWTREDRWYFDPNRADDGRVLTVGGHHVAGTAVRVVYAERPSTFDLAGSMSQAFTTTTGLDARHEGLLLLGVAYKMAAFVDIAKLPFLAAEARADGEAKQNVTGATAARLLYSMFNQRLQQEAAVLAKENPIRLHRVR